MELRFHVACHTCDKRFAARLIETLLAFRSAQESYRGKLQYINKYINTL
jgi:hypothetical protein